MCNLNGSYEALGTLYCITTLERSANLDLNIRKENYCNRNLVVFAHLKSKFRVLRRISTHFYYSWLGQEGEAGDGFYLVFAKSI